jgi:protein SCO1/2
MRILNMLAALTAVLLAPLGQLNAAAPGLTRTIARYNLPPVTLTRDDGHKVLLSRELDDGRPVVLNFIYTSCPGICPLSSQMFSQLQRDLGADRARVHLVSISIDPEADTPARLRAYARKYHAGRNWQHYTGSLADIVATERSFGTYFDDKMDHPALTLVRRSPEAPWVRFDGFATPEVLIKEIRSPQPAPAPVPGAHH